VATNDEGVESSNNESIRSLISSVKNDAQSLLKGQVELTTTELKQSAEQGMGVGAMFIGALMAAAMGGIFVLITLAYVLVAVGLPVWAGFGIVALLLLIIAGILALIGKMSAKKIESPKLAKIEWERTQAALNGREVEQLPVVASSNSVAASSKTSS
jgi:hypothetical protein